MPNLLEWIVSFVLIKKNELKSVKKLDRIVLLDPLHLSVFWIWVICVFQSSTE